jgi:hypothetical protein
MSMVMGAAQTGMSLSAANRKPPETKPEAPADIGREEAITAAKMAEMRRRNQRSGGRASTIMSGSPLGVPAPATTAKKYLTGA